MRLAPGKPTLGVHHAECSPRRRILLTDSGQPVSGGRVAVAVELGVVVPVDPAERGEFDVVDGAPRPYSGL